MQKYSIQTTTFLLTFTISAILTIPLSEIDRADGVMVRTVPFGTTVVLKCRSNDYKHNFQYWHWVNKGIVIGPANTEYDLAKFKYEVLSGNLTIKAVSKDEEGLYECVSRAVHGEDMNIRVVRMIVQSPQGDWEEVYEHDYNINLIRILIALITLVLISMGAWFGYRMWKERYRYPSYLAELEQDDDDDSQEELFSQPGTSRARSPIPALAKHKAQPHQESFDTVDISTDFNSIMETVNGK